MDEIVEVGDIYVPLSPEFTLTYTVLSVVETAVICLVVGRRLTEIVDVMAPYRFRKEWTMRFHKRL